MITLPRIVRWAAFLAAAYFLPYVVVSPADRLLLITALIYTMLAGSWNLTLGFGGIFNFAHIGIFGLGGYGYAIALVRWEWDSVPALLFATLVGGVAGALTYIPVIRMRGVYVALITFVFVQISNYLVIAVPDLTGGTSGLPGLPAFTVAGHNFALNGSLGYAWLLGFSAVVMLIFLELVMASSFGHSLIALRDNEQLAESRGISRRRQQLIAFVISGLMGGFTGALYVSFFRVADVSLFSFGFVGLGLSMIFLGGARQTWGPAVGAVVITLVNQRLSDYGAWQSVIIAAATILILIFAPGGLSGAVMSLVSRTRSLTGGRTRRAPAAVAQGTRL